MSLLFKNVELEITNKCNAECPGCRRTLHSRGFDLTDIEPEILFKTFEGYDLTQKRIRLCGVLGDPMMHPEVLKISQWFLDKKAKLHISTNASLRSEDLWRELGSLSKSSDNLYIQFAVDGLEDTNHLYRVNTDFKTIMRNMDAYVSAGGDGGWIFIEFDHNRHQIEQARELARERNLEFFVRRAAKNNIQEWKVKKEKKKVDYKVTSTGGQSHREAETYKKIREGDFKFDHTQVNCKLVHEGEFFIAADSTVWPCCYLWDEYQKNETTLFDIINKQESDFNSLKKYSLEEIFNSKFYEKLQELWHEESSIFLKRCHSSCGAKGKLRNSFSKN